MPESGKLHWHPAFVQAMWQELFEFREFLEFTAEDQLTMKPLQIDLVIIKKKKDVTIDKNIARIFRGVNIFEYKSPSDHLAVGDFHQVEAYARLYTRVHPETALSNITLTFVSVRHPREFLRYLKEERKYAIKEQCTGIYNVTGDYLPIQVIESKRLSNEENIWLNSLGPDLKADALTTILKCSKDRERNDCLRAYLDIIARANPKTFAEETKMPRTYPTFEEVIREAGLMPRVEEIFTEKWMEKGLAQGMAQGIVQGMAQGMEQGIVQGRLETARNALAKGMSLELIRDITGIDMETLQSLADGQQPL